MSRFETETQRCGILGYFAPEIMRNQTDNHSIDTWCLGVIGYSLFKSKFQYDKNHFQRSYFDILYSVINEKYSFPKRQDNNTEEAQIIILLIECLEKDPKQHINISDIEL